MEDEFNVDDYEYKWEDEEVIFSIKKILSKNDPEKLKSAYVYIFGHKKVLTKTDIWHFSTIEGIKEKLELAQLPFGVVFFINTNTMSFEKQNTKLKLYKKQNVQ